MKKFLSVLLITAMLLATASAATLGGWQTQTDTTVTDEARAAFDKAMTELVGVNYVPVALLATQVVSGTNYCLLCQSTVVYPGAQMNYCLVYLYEDLDGKVEITNIVSLDIAGLAEVVKD